MKGKLSQELLPRDAEEEAESLLLVGRFRADGEGEVEREGRGPERGDIDPQADARSYTEGVLEGDGPLNRAEVAEHDPLHHVIRGEREKVFHRVDEFEASADADRVVNRGRSAEREAAKGVVAAGEIVLEDRGIVSLESKLGAQSKDVPPGAVGPLAEHVILGIVELSTAKVKVSKDLLVGGVEIVPFRR